MLTTLILAALLTPAPTLPAWGCTPTAVAACREVRVTCAVADPAAAAGWTLAWDLGDGGGSHPGPSVERVLPAGLTGYAVRLVGRRGGHTASGRLVLPLDPATLTACPGLPADAGAPPPLPERPPGATRVALVSDSNGPYGAVAQGEGAAAAVRALVERVRPDLVVHVGDMVAGQKRGLDEGRLRAMWAGYAEAVADPLAAAGVPLLPVPGNHDAAPDPALADRAAYRAFWEERRPPPAVALVAADGWPFRYAARLGDTLLVVLDAPTGRVTAADRGWLADVLGAGAPGVTLVFAHVPPWQPTRRAYGTLRGWSELAPLLRRGGVDLLVSGHYEVFYPTVLDGVEVLLDGTLAAACAPRDDVPGCRCRPLAGSELCQGLSFVVLDSAQGRVVQRFAVHGPDFDRVLPAAWLPAEVTGHPRAPGWR